tara:strand:+ start:1898 stop:2194 length:297 start_codon:yes stop_codon:yes gene_type:complete
MLVSIFALFILFYLAKNISIKIKEIKTENEDENQTNFWMFTYDFKKKKRDSIFERDSVEVINTKKKKNDLIVLLYLTHIAIFIYGNYFLSKVLMIILK